MKDKLIQKDLVQISIFCTLFLKVWFVLSFILILVTALGIAKFCDIWCTISKRNICFLFLSFYFISSLKAYLIFCALSGYRNDHQILFQITRFRNFISSNEILNTFLYVHCKTWRNNIVEVLHQEDFYLVYFSYVCSN